MRMILAMAIYWFSEILTTIMLVRAVLSWLHLSPYSIPGKIYQFCIRITEPVVAPCRRLLSRFNTGMFDFSLVLAFLLVQLVANLIVRILL